MISKQTKHDLTEYLTSLLTYDRTEKEDGDYIIHKTWNEHNRQELMKIAKYLGVEEKLGYTETDINIYTPFLMNNSDNIIDASFETEKAVKNIKELSHYVDINCKNKEGYSPLMSVIKTKNIEVINTLLELGADPNTQNDLKWNSVSTACSPHGNEEALKCILSNSKIKITEETLISGLSSSKIFDNEGCTSIIQGELERLESIKSLDRVSEIEDLMGLDR